jgi:hypothetical protein
LFFRYNVYNIFNWLLNSIRMIFSGDTPFNGGSDIQVRDPKSKSVPSSLVNNSQLIDHQAVEEV